MTSAQIAVVQEALAAHRARQAAVAKLTDEEKLFFTDVLKLEGDAPIAPAPKRRGRKPGSKSKAAEVPQTA